MSRPATASPLWIAPAEPATPSACAACTRPVPRVASSASVAAHAVPPVQLQGDQVAGTRLLRALRAVQDPDSGLDLVAAGWVHGLRIEHDEAELTLLSRTAGCSVARVLAEDAFNVLRRELPNTDLYIRHVRDTSGTATGGGCLHPVPQVLVA